MKTKIIVFMFFCCNSIYSQLNYELEDELTRNWTQNDKQKLITANKYFTNQEFLFAGSIYDSLYKKHNTDVYIGYLLGSCNTYDSRFQINSESLIKAAEPIKTKLADYDYYLGCSYLVNNKFKDAIVQFEKYKQNPLHKAIIEEVDYKLSICKNALALENKAAVVKITNIGTPINSAGSEYTPVFPSNESFMIFTYRGERSMGGKQTIPNRVDEKNGIYFEDVMMSVKDEKGKWTDPKPVASINTNGHDATVYISHDGQKLFIYRNVGMTSGDIYMSVLDGMNWSVPEKVKGINSQFWEGSVCLSPDEKTIWFSSERPGGLGGRDIYYAQEMPDGSWGNIKNAGPVINTKFDEDAPFIHSDGKTLFFASTGHNTIGGYDIFRSDLKENKWTTPYNVGKPINTTQDDKFYIVSSDGDRGYYSSDKRTGHGQQDIYIVEPGLFGRPTALVMVNGNVTFDNAPVKAQINVRSKLNHKDFSGLFHSNSITGNYLVNLPSGNEYEIEYNYQNRKLIKDISTAKVDSFAKIEINAELFSDEYIRLNYAEIDSSALRPDMNLSMSNEELMAKYGSTIVDSLEYTVQIGAYKIQENFNYAKLIGLPKAERKTFSDNITRFTLGRYKTLNEVNALLQKAIKNGIKDAFIIAVYKGEKYYFTELLNQRILK